MLTVVFSVTFNQVYLVVEDTKDHLILSISDVTYQFSENRFQNRFEIPVQWYTVIRYTCVLLTDHRSDCR